MEKKKILHIAQSPGGVAEYIYILLNKKSEIAILLFVFMHKKSP